MTFDPREKTEHIVQHALQKLLFDLAIAPLYEIWKWIRQEMWPLFARQDFHQNMTFDPMTEHCVHASTKNIGV